MRTIRASCIIRIAYTYILYVHYVRNTTTFIVCIGGNSLYVILSLFLMQIIVFVFLLPCDLNIKYVEKILCEWSVVT